MRRIHVIILFCLFFGSALSQNKRNIIEKTTFINNDRIGSKILINQIELKPPSMLRFNSIDFDRRLLKLDAINLKNFYNANGFLEVAIKDSFNISNGLVEIFFIISEGRQYFLSDVKINGLQSINHEEVLEKLGLKIGEPYNPVKINTNLSMLNDMLENEGKIFSSIEVDQVINDSVDVLIMVDEGKSEPGSINTETLTT